MEYFLEKDQDGGIEEDCDEEDRVFVGYESVLQIVETEIRREEVEGADWGKLESAIEIGFAFEFWGNINLLL